MGAWRWRRGHSLLYVAREGGWQLGSVLVFAGVLVVCTGFHARVLATIGALIGAVALAILIGNLLPTKSVTSAEVTAGRVTLVCRYRRRTYPRDQLRRIWFQYRSDDWGWVYFELLDGDRRSCVRSWSGPVSWAIAEEATRVTGVETRWAPEKSRPIVSPGGVSWTPLGIPGFSETFE
ncbi:hypothetical protein [Cryptosporangium aurantiacum]|uniref:Uncharacterized protein n=1 Tax=Cryptosporangium aurantiacum TaxID=134849 RepID=A0A1M7R238_9ACTN|nr:hypothetical protein [Cryptosporangium aurantiacum]SHN38765.1 hypothetical protein SAMN05443668_106135 [Cryptosporangium aurantiacum]